MYWITQAILVSGSGSIRAGFYCDRLSSATCMDLKCHAMSNPEKGHQGRPRRQSGGVSVLGGNSGDPFADQGLQIWFCRCSMVSVALWLLLWSSSNGLSRWSSFETQRQRPRQLRHKIIGYLIYIYLVVAGFHVC